MTPRRVVITGIGAITPIGIGADGLWDGVMANRSAVRTIDRFDASPFPSRIAAQVDDFDPADHLDARRARRLDRFSALSVAASRMAFEDAGLDAGSGRCDHRRLDRLGARRRRLRRGAARRLRGRAACAAWLPRSRWPSSAVPARATWRSTSALTGPTVGNANSCASGAVAIGQAFGAIRDGTVDAALAGGAEAPLAPLTFGAFAMIRVLSQRNDEPSRASRPFDRDRDGFVMGEGAAMLALEERGRHSSAARGSWPRSWASAPATTRTT